MRQNLTAKRVAIALVLGLLLVLLAVYIEFYATPDEPGHVELIRNGAGQLLVPVTIDGQEYQFVLDTGSPYVLLRSDDTNAQSAVDAERIELAFGSGVRTGTVAEVDLRCGDHSASDFAIMLLDEDGADLDSLLGRDVDGILGLAEPDYRDDERLDWIIEAMMPTVSSYSIFPRAFGHSTLQFDPPVLGADAVAYVESLEQDGRTSMEPRVAVRLVDADSGREAVGLALLDSDAETAVTIDHDLWEQLSPASGDPDANSFPMNVNLFGDDGDTLSVGRWSPEDAHIVDLSHTDYDIVLGLDVWRALSVRVALSQDGTVVTTAGR